MARKKGNKSVTPRQKKEIIITHASNQSLSETAKKYKLSECTIRKIVQNNIELSKDISEALNQSMVAGAGIVGNCAIEGLKRKNLDNGKEKASTLAVVAGEMRKIVIGDSQPAVQFNITMPRSRAELINFLNNDKVIDLSSNNDNADKVINNVPEDNATKDVDKSI